MIGINTLANKHPFSYTRCTFWSHFLMDHVMKMNVLVSVKDRWWMGSTQWLTSILFPSQDTTSLDHSSLSIGKHSLVQHLMAGIWLLYLQVRDFSSFSDTFYSTWFHHGRVLKKYHDNKHPIPYTGSRFLDHGLFSTPPPTAYDLPRMGSTQWPTSTLSPAQVALAYPHGILSRLDDFSYTSYTCIYTTSSQSRNTK